MRWLRTALIAAALIAGLTPAKAQQFSTIPSGTVIGRTQAGAGPAQPIPFSTLIASMLASSPTIPTINTSSVLFSGSVSGTATVQAQAAAGTPSIRLPTSSGTLADTATSPIILDAVAGAIGCPTCVVGSGSSTAGDLPSINNTSTNQVVSAGYNASQVPGLVPSTATVTISNASPGVITWPAHGLTANAPVYFCTTGTLPTGLTACVPGTGGSMPPNTYQSDPTLFYVVGSSITPNTFTVATSIANAKAGIAVNTSSAGSGTHTAFANAMACAGCIGEHKWIVVPVSGTGSVACNNSSPDTLWASLTLQPGIWKIWGSTGVFGSAAAVFATNHTSYGIGISSIQSTPYGGTTDWHITTNNSNGVLYPLESEIVPVFAANTAVNVYSEPVWSGGGATATCFGEFHAMRVH